MPQWRHDSSFREDQQLLGIDMPRNKRNLALFTLAPQILNEGASPGAGATDTSRFGAALPLPKVLMSLNPFKERIVGQIDHCPSGPRESLLRFSHNQLLPSFQAIADKPPSHTNERTCYLRKACLVSVIQHSLSCLSVSFELTRCLLQVLYFPPALPHQKHWCLQKREGRNNSSNRPQVSCKFNFNSLSTQSA